MSVKIIPGVTIQTYVVEGAFLLCTMGTSPGKLSLPLGHGVYIHDLKQANIMDNKPMLNIAPFGMCNATQPIPLPCTPITVSPWLNGKPDMMIDNFPALLKNSILICGKGGLIRIQMDGQKMI